MLLRSEGLYEGSDLAGMEVDKRFGSIKDLLRPLLSLYEGSDLADMEVDKRLRARLYQSSIKAVLRL